MDDVPDFFYEYLILGLWLLFLAFHFCDWLFDAAAGSFVQFRFFPSSILLQPHWPMQRSSGIAVGLNLERGVQWRGTVGTGPLGKDLRSLDWRLVGPYKTVTSAPVRYSTSTPHRVNPIITIGCCTPYSGVVMKCIYTGIKISSSFILIQIVHWMDRQATPCHATHTHLPLSHWRSSPESLGRYRYGVRLVFDILYRDWSRRSGFNRIDRGSTIGCTPSSVP